jgi:septum formation protein
MIRLASSSISRAKILRDFGVEFTQSGLDFDEDSVISSCAKEFVYKVALGKYGACRKKFGLEMPFLVADTVISVDGKILRKAKDKDEAKKILKLQSGSSTTIITCMIYESKELYFLDIASTHYQFEVFEKEDLENYLNSDDWRGKAGACMVEGFCKKYIKDVKGLESNAKGLGIERLLPFV